MGCLSKVNVIDIWDFRVKHSLFEDVHTTVQGHYRTVQNKVNLFNV